VEIDPCSMSPSAVYTLLIGCIVPRPIAWVSTASADGAHNVAPFSRDDLYDPGTGRVDMRRLKPVGRLAGEMYTHVHDLFEMKRPVSSYAG
jgi:hypothetical protein